MTEIIWFVAGILVGQLALVAALALTRGARDQVEDEHEESV